ncbi:hypothetical protein SSX86_000442 [Deinandra increscens subsp. villosa]|uniref:Transposase n=1 Tax=Deinandra increscens subsp. villosa TaxID=3103831 RepID=A0AAP0HBL1_9ASTR
MSSLRKLFHDVDTPTNKLFHDVDTPTNNLVDLNVGESANLERVTVETKDNGKTFKKDECIHCKKKYKPSPGGVTGSTHSKSCPYMKRLKGTNNGFINSEACSSASVSASASPSGFSSNGGYDQMKCREMIAKMIIAHELPFLFVEYHWFNRLMECNNHLYQKVSWVTVRKDCVKVVEVEREKLKKVLENVDMVSLSGDRWTSNQTIDYMCLTAHFIDSDWKLRKCVIGFNELAPPRSGEGIADGILECLVKWGIEDKIGTITLDNVSSNDMAASSLRDKFQRKGKLHFEGLFFHVRCCAHILNLIAQDGLRTIDCCLVKIREGVKYFRKSRDRLLEFGKVATSFDIDTRRSLCIDVKTRWNSTLRMLESAVHYKLAFQEYALRDSNFEWCPTEAEWARAEKVCRLLEVFLDTTNLFSGTSYPTSNLFLIEVFKVKKEINNAYISKDEFLKNMSVPMYEKFEKYWGEMGVLMSIASILDPRFKLLALQFTFERLYPVNELTSRIGDVTNKLKSLYEKYSKATKVNSSSTKSSGSPNVHGIPEDDFYAYLKSRPVETPQKTELEMYLEEPNCEALENPNFDVLQWWRQNCNRFPILSKMAREVFGIPFTTVTSESAFNVGGRILDEYRSALSKDMVELLVCGGDWIKSASLTSIKTLEQSVKEEENLEIQIP